MSNETTVTATATTATFEIGMIMAFYGETLPTNWLLCDGSEIPDNYGNLINQIGENTPNLCARVIMGEGTGEDSDGYFWPATMGNSGGEYFHTLLQTEMPSHQHLGWGQSYDSNWDTGRSENTGYRGSDDSDTDNYLYGSTFTGGNLNSDDLVATNNDTVTATAAGTTSGHNNVQPYFVLKYIIYAGTN